MIPENLTKEELVAFVKKSLIRVTKDYLIFKAGEYYDLFQDQDMDGLITLILYDDEGNGYNLSTDVANDILESK